MLKNEDTKLSEHSLGRRIADSKPFSKAFNDPIWDWATQRWKGTIIRDSGCNYYDFSVLRPILLHELRTPIINGLKGNLEPLNRVINDIDSDITLKHGDLIQIGKSKNRGLFLVSTDRLLPITQLLGGNGFGEIPLNFIFDLSNDKNQDYDSDHWTFQNHPIINHVPYLKDINKAGEPLNCQNIRIGGQSFTISEGSDSLNHPYVYLDFDNNEFFTLPAGIKQRFDTEIDRITSSFITGDCKNLLEPSDDVKPSMEPPSSNMLTTKPKARAKAKANGTGKGRAPWLKKWAKKETKAPTLPKVSKTVVPRIPIMIKLKPSEPIVLTKPIITLRTTDLSNSMKPKTIIDIRPRSQAPVQLSN